MLCNSRKYDPKEYYSDNEDRYYEERKEAFLEFIKDLAEEYADNEDLRLNSIDFAESIEEEFHFPTIDEWMSLEYEGMLGDCADAAYELKRDREMGLV